jgi:hypothetical protein
MRATRKRVLDAPPRDSLEAAYAIAYGDRFRNSLVLACRDLAAVCEETAVMRAGPHSGSFLDSRVMAPQYDGRFSPLVAAMTMAD